MLTRLYFIKALSEIHCGVGQSVGDIDLPTARESVSGYPFIPGSSLKGVLRDELASGKNSNDMLDAAFGWSRESTGDKADPSKKEQLMGAAALSFGDSRLLCLPVRSFCGTFAWMTSSYALAIFRENLIRSGREQSKLPPLPIFEPEQYSAFVTSDSRIMVQNSQKILLEDLDIAAVKPEESSADKWASLIADMVFAGDEDSAKLFKERFCVVHDDVFSYVCQTSLPVVARIKIDDTTGTVAKGGLWYEENVPCETIFQGVILADEPRGKYRELTAARLLDGVAGEKRCIQIGGNATVGRGFVQISFNGGAGEGK